MKPLGLALDEMRNLLTVLDALGTGTERAALLDRLDMFHTAATTRVTALREQLVRPKASPTPSAPLEHHGGSTT